MFDMTFTGRIDSPQANNAELNLEQSNSDPVTITFVGDPAIEQNDTNTTVTIIGTINGVTYDGTVEYSFDVAFSAFMPSAAAGSNNGDLGKVPDVLEGQSVYLITIPDILNGGAPLRIAFLPNVPDTDPNSAQIANISESAITLVGTNFNPPVVNVCFAAGTQISTPDGLVNVESLRVGDLVSTADGGAQPVIWVGQTQCSWPGSAETQKPIQFAQGCMSVNVPSQHLVVSPQHHILIEAELAQTLFGAREVLAPAKGLLGLPGVRVMQGKRDVTYVHLMFAQHEIVMAHAVATESFYPGPTAVRMLSPAQRASLYAVVPTLKEDPENGYGPTARLKITRRQAEKLVKSILAARNELRVAAE